ncbi:MAG TPA: hypothetical protein VNZ57_11990 [Longimicrobiales bacterium]|nr:hypothetical protein [Longimicrobiales bacterium]
MTTREDLESFIIRMGVDAEEVADGMWVIPGADGSAPVVINYSPPMVLLRLKVMHLPEGVSDHDLAPFYRRLLELNATDIVHGSYGIEEGDVVLSDALELDSLDYAELQSSYESLVVAASSHLAGLAQLVPAAHEE